ncbi:MAG: A/G-specific adenine glycosylase [Treponema sp.]|jgi:A/G-specific adenine glycosylase|nr:A/G-specific adenine glycosylase [Treponema sp.]
MDIAEFRKIIYRNFKQEGRSFPWRQEDATPWGVAVSEFMLQQTQTGRVVPYWERWMRLWPTPEDLARASLEDTLREWSGLGYNNRARRLRECARIIAERHGGRVPGTPGELLLLPGIGAYTAGAIACFAYNYPSVFIETNIRATVIHFFFEGRRDVSDAEMLPILESALDRRNPRKWHWALMDYGAALKKITPNPGRRSAHYARQSPFQGSFRQIRGSLVRSLVSQGPASAPELGKRTGIETQDVYKALNALKKDAMVAEDAGIYRIEPE